VSEVPGCIHNVATRRARALQPYPALKGRATVIPPLRGDRRRSRQKEEEWQFPERQSLSARRAAEPLGCPNCSLRYAAHGRGPPAAAIAALEPPREPTSYPALRLLPPPARRGENGPR